MATDTIDGTDGFDRIHLGSGRQTVNGGGGRDYIISYGDGGEPDPAQTDGADGRVNPAIADGTADDVLTGGAGGDIFEFRALINATDESRTQHTGVNGSVNWGAVAGENDNVHDHWVEGFGNDVITDFSKAECDKIVIRGHTVEIAEITYGSDENGDYSLISVISQQGNGGAGGANTETGAHDEDRLGTIKVYGDKVEECDVAIKRTTDGYDQLERADAAYGDAEGGVTQEVFSNTDGDAYHGILANQIDKVHVGLGSQTVNAGGGRDFIVSYSDGGEPDPAQTDGAGRVNPAVPEGAADDVLTGGQGADTFAFNLLINAKADIIAKHTRDDDSVNWKGVAGENGNVHDHWVEGIGNDVITDFSNQDGDKILIRGHTVEIADIVYGEDGDGDYSLIFLRSQQGDGGGAHDEDLLGTITVYGDKVTEDDITVNAGVFDGIDKLDEVGRGEASSPADNDAPVVTQIRYGADNPEDIDLQFTGTHRGDTFTAGSGSQAVSGGRGNDRFISFGDAGEPDPEQTDGADGRINQALADGAADDVFTGGAGADRFEFHALINATREVIEAHTDGSGRVNWARVAGENDNVHDHWVEGFGNDVITDFSLEQRDKIIIRGHTVEIDDITYGSDENGAYSLISVISQQGNGGAGGANTETGAHDEDSLGTIKVYGDKVTEDDIKVQRGGVVDGADRLRVADKLADYNGGVQTFASSTDGATIETAPDTVKTMDTVRIGSGAQTVDAGAGRDVITSYSDGGEPDPAQTDGADGRVNPPVDPAASGDTVTGGQGRDIFDFNLLINATDVIIAKHMRDDGSVNWRRVAGENDAVHDHWVEGIGDDVVTDFSNQDGDKIVIRGHTVEIADITYGEDADGDYSLITLRSQQGDNGGAHDEDSLGTVKIYGDKVTEDDIKLKANVFDGIDKYEALAGVDGDLVTGGRGNDALSGTDRSDIMHGRRGHDLVDGDTGEDFLFGGSGRDTLTGGGGDDQIQGGGGRDQLLGGDGNDTLVADAGRDLLFGGSGNDVFVFEDRIRAATIGDWQDGVDLIDFSRNDAVESLDDLDIDQTSQSTATITYENDKGKLVTIDVIGSAAFVLDQNDFVF